MPGIFRRVMFPHDSIKFTRDTWKIFIVLSWAIPMHFPGDSNCAVHRSLHFCWVVILCPQPAIKNHPFTTITLILWSQLNGRALHESVCYKYLWKKSAWWSNNHVWSSFREQVCSRIAINASAVITSGVILSTDHEMMPDVTSKQNLWRWTDK